MTAAAEKSDKEEKCTPSWIKYIALGDSTSALFGSFLLLVVSISIALSLENGHSISDTERAYRKLLPVPKIDPPRIFEIEKTENGLVSDAMRKAWTREGVICVRGLIDDDTLKQLDEASTKIISEQQDKNGQKPRGALSGKKKPGRKKQFYTTKQGVIFLEPPSIEEDSIQDEILPPFLKVSFMGDIPLIAAELLQLNAQKNETLRVMRDIFLAKDEEEFICGWHVDDTGFWPATAEARGVNAWIALDDMPVEKGGGFALAVGSHTAHWREEAYNVTGTTHTFPEEGFRNATDMLDNRVGNGTCNIKNAANHIYRRMEETKRVYNIKKGDIIFHERWLFHRTIPFEREAVKNRIATGSEEELMYRRYSIRYGPGTSVIPKGWGTELSVLWNGENAGRTADDVALHDGPWYPKVWPEVSNEELRRIEEIVERMPSVNKQFEARRKQLAKPAKRFRKQY